MTIRSHTHLEDRIRTIDDRAANLTAPSPLSHPGLTITEAIFAMVIISIGVLGAATMRYQSSLDARRAEVGITASRLALMMLEAWAGQQASTSFDPVTPFASTLDIESDEGPAEPNGFTLLGKYKLTVNQTNYYATLAYKDIDVSLRQINVTIAWNRRGLEEVAYEDTDETFGLTKYVEQ